MSFHMLTNLEALTLNTFQLATFWLKAVVALNVLAICCAIMQRLTIAATASALAFEPKNACCPVRACGSHRNTSDVPTADILVEGLRRVERAD